MEKVKILKNNNSQLSIYIIDFIKNLQAFNLFESNNEIKI